LVVSGGRWGVLGVSVLLFITLRIQDFTSVLLRLFRSVGVWKTDAEPSDDRKTRSRESHELLIVAL
jgi:hypothetical protein